MVKKAGKMSSVPFVVPVVLATTQEEDKRANIITLAWVGVACSTPPMLSVGVRPSRFSCGIIERSRELVINIPSSDILGEVDYCGSVSGRDVDKFAETGLTPEPSEEVGPPLIKECPINLECKVKHSLDLGAHRLFLCEVVRMHVDERIEEEGKLDGLKLNPLLFCEGGGQYLQIGEELEVS
jgi:flavin reductase (DIM6/NTAB) family NADH-FMN oxidoreductase RutF